MYKRQFQDRADNDKRGDMIAAGNLVDCVLGLMAVGFQYAMMQMCIRDRPWCTPSSREARAGGRKAEAVKLYKELASEVKTRQGAEAAYYVIESLCLGVGLRAGEAVADDNPRNGVAVCARDISVGVAAVGNDLSAVSDVIVIAVAVRAGRENRDPAEEKQQSV